MNKRGKTLLSVIIAVFLLAIVILLIKIPFSRSVDTVANFSSGAGDGYVYHTASDYTTVHDAATGTFGNYSNETAYIGQNYTSGAPEVFEIYRGFFPTDTSSIPDDATINSAKFFFYVTEAQASVNYCINLTTQRYVENLSIEDYSVSLSVSSDCIAVDTTGWFNISISDTSIINKTGYTKLGLRSEQDINSIAASGSEYIIINTSDAATAKPYIEINYSVADTYPVVTLNSPDNNITSITTINFNCSAYDDINVTNISLYGNWTAWHLNETNTTPYNNTPVNFTKIIPEGKYLWNCYACDNISQCSFATSNKSFTIDQTSPTYSDNSTNSTNAGQAVLHRLYWQDNAALSGYIFSFDNGNGSFDNDTWTSLTGASNWSNVSKAVNSTIGSTIQWKVYTNDSVNNWNLSSSYNYTTIQPSSCEQNVTDCTTISSAGYYCLINNITEASTDPCINIGANNVTFDGQGYLIDGTGTLTSIQTLYVSNVTIKNLTVKEWNIGVNFVAGNNNTVKNCSLESNDYSIYTQTSSTNNTVSDNTIAGSIFAGIYIDGGSGNNISYNNISATSVKTPYGVEFSSSNNNVVNNNTLTSLNFTIRFSSSHNNTVDNNTIINSTKAGFELISSFDNNLTGNSLTNPETAGIKVNNSNRNRFLSNNVTNATDVGFELINASYNLLRLNRMENTNGSASISVNDSLNNNLTNNTIESPESAGINLYNSNYSIIINNTINNPGIAASDINLSWYNDFRTNYFTNVSTAKAFRLTESYYNNFTGDYLRSSRPSSTLLLMALTNSDNNIISGLDIDLIDAGATYSTIAIYFSTGADSNTIKDSTIKNCINAIYMSSSDSNSIQNNSFYNISGNISSGYYGAIYTISGTKNNISNNTVNNSEYGFVLDTESVGQIVGQGDIIENNTLNNTNYSFYISDSEGIKINNNTIIDDGKWALYSIESENANITNLRLETATINCDGNNFSLKSQEIANYPEQPYESINISFNATNTSRTGYARVNTTYTSVSGDETTLKMYYLASSQVGVGRWTVVSDSGVNADANYVWSILNWSKYPAQEKRLFAPLLNNTAENVSNCTTISSAGYYQLNTSVSSNGTCFNITADHVTLDCDGYVINYSAGELGYAVNNSANYTLVKDCRIFTGGNINNSHGIYSTTTYNTFQNNSFNTSVNASAIYSIDNYSTIFLNTIQDYLNGINTSRGSNISYNVINITGLGIVSYRNNTIQYNNITAATCVNTTDINHTLIGNRLTECTSYGFFISNSNTTSINNSFTDNKQDVLVITNTANNTLTTDNFSGTLATLDYDDITDNLLLNSTPYTLADNSSYIYNISNISKYISLAGNSSSIRLNISYTHANLGSVQESSLQMFSYDNTTQIWSLEANTGVDQVNDIVWAIIDATSGVNLTYAPIGNTTSSIASPENFSINLRADNETMKLNWSQASGVDGYYIWYSDNETWILQLNETELPANVTVSGATNTSWNDTTANETTYRFYALASYVGSTENFSSTKVGKHKLIINSESNIGHSMLSLPFNQTINISSIVAPNNYTYIYYINESANDSWIYAYYYKGWLGTLTTLEFGKGYYFNNFNSSVNLTSYGEIPTGNVTQTINNETDIRHNLLGWESYTDGNISTLLASPPNNYTYIYTVNESANDTWSYAYYYNTWLGNLTTFEIGKGYYFNGFNESMSLTYERNPN